MEVSGATIGYGSYIGDGENVNEELASIAMMAYGSRTIEGKRGGNGYVGLLENRVVKFATHSCERNAIKSYDENAKNEMYESCNGLRKKLVDIAKKVMGSDTDGLKKVYKELGIDCKDDSIVLPKKLLERKVVARVIGSIQKSCGKNLEDPWKSIETKCFLESDDNMSFRTVKERVSVLSDVCRYLNDGLGKGLYDKWKVQYNELIGKGVPITSLLNPDLTPFDDWVGEVAAEVYKTRYDFETLLKKASENSLLSKMDISNLEESKRALIELLSQDISGMEEGSDAMNKYCSDLDAFSYSFRIHLLNICEELVKEKEIEENKLIADIGELQV